MLEAPLRQFLENDPALRLNRVERILHSTVVTHNQNTWISSTRREQGGVNAVSIGMQALPEDVATRWGMGANDVNEQTLVRLAHELAHAFQDEKGFEGALVKFLNGDDSIPENFIPYIELYTIISEVGPINGLTTEAVYAEQGKLTGNLKMEILEDITELISAHIISDDYFLLRLENSA